LPDSLGWRSLAFLNGVLHAFSFLGAGVDT